MFKLVVRINFVIAIQYHIICLIKCKTYSHVTVEINEITIEINFLLGLKEKCEGRKKEVVYGVF